MSTHETTACPLCSAAMSHRGGEEEVSEIQMFDVLATNLKTGKRRIIDMMKTEANAEAIVQMAVMRRGVDEEIFAAVEHGSYVL